VHKRGYMDSFAAQCRSKCPEVMDAVVVALQYAIDKLESGVRDSLYEAKIPGPRKHSVDANSDVVEAVFNVRVGAMPWL
jgi:hypothetical protein